HGGWAAPAPGGRSPEGNTARRAYSPGRPLPAGLAEARPPPGPLPLPAPRPTFLALAFWVPKPGLRPGAAPVDGRPPPFHGLRRPPAGRVSRALGRKLASWP